MQSGINCSSAICQREGGSASGKHVKTFAYLLVLVIDLTFVLLFYQGVPMESHPSKIVGSRGSKNRFFDFDKLAEV